MEFSCSRIRYSSRLFPCLSFFILAILVLIRIGVKLLSEGLKTRKRCKSNNLTVRPNENGTIEFSVLDMLLFVPLTTNWAFFANPEFSGHKIMTRVSRCILGEERPRNNHFAMVAQKRRNIAKISMYYFVETISKSSSETQTGIFLFGRTLSSGSSYIEHNSVKLETTFTY